MSQANVEVVREALKALNERDIDRYLSYCTDDVQLRLPADPFEVAYEGPDGIRRYFADIEDTMPDFRLDADSVEAIGLGRVIASLRVTATGRASGAPTAAPVTTVYDLVGGKMKRIRVFRQRQQALEATGLAG